MNTQTQELQDFFGEVISSYSRAQAIEDGVLVDVSETAKEAGFRFPVAITQAAWEDCVAWSEEDNTRQCYQDQSGRLWDVLTMLFYAIRGGNGGSNILFEFIRIPRGGRAIKGQEMTLKALCGPGDDMEPVITIMLPDED